MASLKELSEEETLTVDQIKTRVFPLLKGNPLLVEWFQQCFPSERITDLATGGTDQFESLNFHKACEAADDPDVYEYIPQSELVPDPVENPCYIRYINGNIYYGGRILLPAQLSFQVHSFAGKAVHHSQISSRCDETPSSSSVMSCTSNYKCVHDIKRFGDIKFREQLRAHIENDSHVATYSGANASVAAAAVEVASECDAPG